MKEINLKDLQSKIKDIDFDITKKDKYFMKFIEEVGELSKAIRNESTLEKNNNNLKETINEELYDVLYYTICLANIYDVDLTKTAYEKENINSNKYKRPNMFDSK